jgi:hypothetical protein
MAQGPFPFLRATYWRWAETIFDVCPELKSAPSALSVGDLHLENFGTWRDDDGRLVWGVNDFDEAAEMPYVLDLVRLAASALLGCPHVGTPRTISANMLKGYQRGLANPHPIVLDQDYDWLRNLVVVPISIDPFLAEDGIAQAAEARAPQRYVKVLAGAMPAPKLKTTFSPRTAGLGSLGRPRWVGLAQWQGAPVVREVKAALPSAWTRANGGSRALNCFKIAAGRHRAPDPWFGLKDGIVVGVSPNNRKLDAETHPLDLISGNTCARWDAGCAIHLGNEREGRHRAISRTAIPIGSRPRPRAANFIRRERGNGARVR